MMIFLGIMAVIFMLLTYKELNEDYKKIYAGCYAKTLLGMALFGILEFILKMG